MRRPRAPTRGRAPAARRPGRASRSTGFRFCGIVEEPPASRSRTSPTSVSRAGRCRARSSRALPPRGRATRRGARPASAPHARAAAARPARAPPRTAARPRAPRRRAPRACRRHRRAGRPARTGRAPAARRARPRASRPRAARTSSAPPAGAASARPRPFRGARARARRRPRQRRRARPTTSPSAPRATSIAGGVDDVLARRAVVDVLRRLAADRLAQQPDERLGWIADRPAAGGDLVPVEPLGPTLRSDRLRRLGGDHARLRLRGRERTPPRSSIASSHARSDTASRSSRRDRDRARRPSQRRRRPSAARPGAGRRSGARRRPRSATSVARSLLAERREHRIVVVRVAGEVHPRQHRLQQPAREDQHLEVRRLAIPRAGLARSRTRSAPSPSVPQRPQPTSACQISTIASGTGASAPSSTRPSIRWRPARHDAVGLGLAEAEREERPDRLRRRRLDHRHSVGVAPTTMSKR